MVNACATRAQLIAAFQGFKYRQDFGGVRGMASSRAPSLGEHCQAMQEVLS
jgi:hypothetical protein